MKLPKPDIGRLVSSGWNIVVENGDIMPGPPDVVWELITDWEHQDDWMLEGSGFSVTSAQREGVGTEAEARIRIGGISTMDRVRVTVWEPPSKLVIEHLAWVKGTGEITLTPLEGDRTYVFWREELVPPLGLAGALGMTAFRPLMARTFKRDLRVLEGLVRARTRRGPNG